MIKLQGKLNNKAQVSFSSWQPSMHIVTHFCQESSMIHESTRRGQLQAVLLDPSWTLPYAFLFLADFNLYLLLWKSITESIIAFSGFCESFEWIIKPEVCLRNLPWLSIGVKSDGDLVDGFPSIASNLRKLTFNKSSLNEGKDERICIYTNRRSHTSYLTVVFSQMPHNKVLYSHDSHEKIKFFNSVDFLPQFTWIFLVTS